MKKLILIATVLMAGALAVPAQQGQGGNPRAFGDKDKDGICDVTGKPVGQGRAAMQGQKGQVQGNGMGCRRRGKGRRGGMNRGRGMQGQAAKAPAAKSTPTETK